MHIRRILIISVCCLFFFQGKTQGKETAEEVDKHSLSLYSEARWQALFEYGKENIASGIDFSLLRMRTGYAAFKLGKYSQSLSQYNKVLALEPDNYSALYYVYLNNLYLKNDVAARFYAKKLSAETNAAEQISRVKLHSVEAEYSHKQTSDTLRKNAQYARLGINVQLGYQFELQQSGALFKQEISEPTMVSVTNNRHINLNLKEYYGKLIFGASGRMSILGGFHYINSPFNNYSYNNSVVFGGVNYTMPFVHVKAMTSFAKLSDSAYSQFDLQASYFPLGNIKLYGITRISYNKQLVASQIMGAKVAEKFWLEANLTIGSYATLLENDALFVFNDIDEKQFKTGASVYTEISKKMVLTLNYTFEQKRRYQTTNNYFYQHSITTGLSWKF
ncbi:MAG: hypothetical protein NTW54_00590 [Bacteroidetes bacterium]|nr:hypothetical protein [Bacteroidota bacterium]